MSKIPVTILTGFLGAGKTTLLNRLLGSSEAAGIAVIVNEFGEIGIDGRLVSRKEGDVIELTNGALCCAAMGDTVKVLTQLLELSGGNPSKPLPAGRQVPLGKGRTLRRVVIETTGLADPFPLVKAFLNRPSLAKAYELDAIVTVVDAFHVLGQLVDMPEAEKQIAAADIILLNKTDLAPAEDLDRVERAIRSINDRAEIRRTQRSDTELLSLVSTKALGTADRPYARAEGFKAETHGHMKGVVSILLRERRPLDLAKLSLWIGSELMLNADRLMRYKGILQIAGKEERFVFQGVHHQFETVPDRPWRDGEDRVSEVVLIGRDLDRAAFTASFAACVAETNSSTDPH